MSDFMDAYFEAQDAEGHRHASYRENPVPLPEWERLYIWDRATDITDREVWRAHSLLDHGYDIQPPTEFELAEEWSNGFRMVWTSLTDKAILSYCEGDLSIEKCHTKERYKAALIEAGNYCREFG